MESIKEQLSDNYNISIDKISSIELNKKIGQLEDKKINSIELNEKIRQLKDQETIRILQLYLEGYTYSEMIPILIREGLSESDQDYVKLTAKLRRKFNRGLRELQRLFT